MLFISQYGHDMHGMTRIEISLCMCLYLFSLFIYLHMLVYVLIHLFTCLYNCCRSRSGFVFAMVARMCHDLSPLGVPLGRARARGQGCTEAVLFVVREISRGKLFAEQAHAVTRGLGGGWVGE